MILRLLLVLALLPCPHLNAMVGSTSSAAPVHMANGTCLAHRPVSTHPISGKPKFSNTEALKDTHISIRERYKQEVATTLDYAARALFEDYFSRRQAVDLVEYLLSKIDPAYIKDPETLLVAALENNHPVLFKYVEKTFGAECTEKAVRDAIREGQQANVEKLLDASVHMKSVRPLLVPTAIRAFSHIDDATTTAERLAILKTVLIRAEVKDVPMAFQLDFNNIPLNVQDGIKRLLNDKLYPTRVCMCENDGETALHRAAADHNYEAALTLLTEAQCPNTDSENYGALALVENYALSDMVRSLIISGDAQTMEKLTSWRGPFGFFSYIDYIKRRYHLEEALQLVAASSTPQGKEKLTEFLLNEIDLDHVQAVGTLHDNALNNGHVLIAKYLYKELPACNIDHQASDGPCIKQCLLKGLSGQSYITKHNPTLHKAAVKQDYKACVALLVAWSGPLEEHEYWPTEATQTIEECKRIGINFANPEPECQSAINRISAFMVSANKSTQERIRVMQAQKRVLNCKGQTAYDLARAARAPQKLLDLLDPNNDDVIRSLVYQDVDRRAEIPHYAGNPPAMVQFPNKSKKARDPNGPFLDVGEKIIIDGLEYKVTTVKKVK